MARKGNGECACGEFDWVDGIPLEQLEFVNRLVYAGFRVTCPQMSDEDKERSLQLIEALSCHLPATTTELRD